MCAYIENNKKTLEFYIFQDKLRTKKLLNKCEFSIFKYMKKNKIKFIE